MSEPKIIDDQPDINWERARQRSAELSRLVCECIEPHPYGTPCSGPQYGAGVDLSEREDDY